MIKQIYKSAKRWGETRIETRHFVFDCAGFSRGRNGFAHESILTDKETFESLYGVSKWVNRTWENHRFESACMDAICNLPEEKRELAKIELKAYFNGESKKLDEMLDSFKKNYDSLSDGQKEKLKNVTVESPEQMKSVCALVNMMSVFNKMDG